MEDSQEYRDLKSSMGHRDRLMLEVQTVQDKVQAAERAMLGVMDGPTRDIKRRALQTLEADLREKEIQIADAQAKVQSCQETWSRAQALPLLSKEEVVYLYALDLILQLDQALRDLESIQGTLQGKYRLPSQRVIPPTVRHVLRSAIDCIKVADPESLGLTQDKLGSSG